jgi:c-di-GMP-related signal transduction protein
MESILLTPMNKILQDLPLDRNIINALNGERNEYGKTLDLVIAIEESRWDYVSDTIKYLHLSTSGVSILYKESVKWSEELMEKD